METKTLKREWVKNAAIIFLSLLLVLTFFSNTILNRSLPEVATKAVTSGQIVAKVRGSGTVEANGAHEVKMKQTKEIRSVMVKVGDEVKTGDVLFVLGAGDSQELEAAKDTLRDLQYSYQRAAVSIPDFDYTTQNRALQNAEIALDEAEDAWIEADKLYKTMKKTLEDDPATKDNLQKLSDAEFAMKAAYENLIAVEKNYDDKYLQLSSQVSAWQQRVNELTYISEPTATPTPETEVTPTPTPEATATATPEAETEDEPVTTAEQAPAKETNQEKLEETNIEQLSFKTLRPVRAKLAAAEPVIPASLSPSEVDDLATAERWLESAQNTLSNFISQNSKTLESARAVYDSAKAKYDSLSKYNESIYYELAPYKQALDVADKALAVAQADYEDAWSALYHAQNSNEKSLALSSLELQQINEKIQLQQEKIKLLSGETEDQVLANVNGIVQSITATAGNTVPADTVLCTIEVPDMGHSISFSVTNEQARRLRTGDTATISNFYWGNEILATLTNIRTDPKNPQSNKVLTFELEGDVQSGAELTLSVGSKSANYDILVPNSAIKSDSNGSFVLAVEAKNSPLGSRYIAKRVSVEVLASDDNNSAIIAELGNGDFVITTSSAPIKNGDQVRLAES